jgi:hypothetical protein
MAREDAVITFFLSEASVNKSLRGYTGVAKIEARVADPDVWEAALEQLNGLEIYKGSDFKTELIRALRGHQETLEGDMERSARENHEALERLTQHFKAESAARIQAEQRVRILEAKIAETSEELGTLRLMAADLAALG